MRSGVPITMVPLDLTHTMLSTQRPPRPLPRARQQVRRRGRRHARLLRTLRSRQSTAGTARPLHDPCVIAFLLKPELFEGRHVNCTIETGERADRRLDGRRLLGRHRPAEERVLPAQRRCRRVLRSADRAGRPPALASHPWFRRHRPQSALDHRHGTLTLARLHHRLRDRRARARPGRRGRRGARPRRRLLGRRADGARHPRRRSRLLRLRGLRPRRDRHAVRARSSSSSASPARRTCSTSRGSSGRQSPAPSR